MTEDAPAPPETIEVWGLFGYAKPHSRNYDSATYALAPEFLPVGAWIEQGCPEAPCDHERIRKITVPRGSWEADSARTNTIIEAQREYDAYRNLKHNKAP